MERMKDDVAANAPEIDHASLAPQYYDAPEVCIMV